MKQMFHVNGSCTSKHNQSPLNMHYFKCNLRRVGFRIALQEEANTLLVWPIRVESWHHHNLPGQVAHKAGGAEHWFTKTAKTLHHKAEGGFWPPTSICNKKITQEDEIKGETFFEEKRTMTKVGRTKLGDRSLIVVVHVRAREFQRNSGNHVILTVCVCGLCQWKW